MENREPVSCADLYMCSGVELRKQIGRRTISPVELTEHLIGRVLAIDPQLNAFCDFDVESIRNAARRAEQIVASSAPLPPLHGLPVSVKDLLVTKGISTARGSEFFRGDRPTFDAPVVERLRKSGAIIFGKTNSSEFGWKGATSNKVYKETRNPWDLSRSPGGSSGGAAASLAAGLCPLALGTDGGGSVRMPASFCGVFGFKPSLGRLPLFPPAPAGPLSHIGPMTRTVNDAALLFRALVGPDERDVYSLPATHEFDAELAPVENLRIGWSSNLGFMPVDEEVAEICAAAARKFGCARCEIVPVDMSVDDPRDALEAIFACGIGGFARRFPDWERRLDQGLADLVRKGMLRTGFDLAEAQVLRATLSSQIASAMADVDVLVTPTVPVKPFDLGLDGPPNVGGEDLGPVRWFGLTATFNFTGQPAASVPCGFDKEGLPVGLQIVGPRFADWLVLRVAKTFEEVAGWSDRWPSISKLKLN